MCRTIELKEDLIRLVKTEGGKVIVDSMQNLPGRGVYVHAGLLCWDNKKMVSAVTRSLGCHKNKDNHLGSQSIFNKGEALAKAREDLEHKRDQNLAGRKQKVLLTLSKLLQTQKRSEEVCSSKMRVRL